MRHTITAIFILLIIIGCTPPLADPTPANTDTYVDDILAWHEGRNERLNQPDSWLTLSGLFWLQEGPNSFGGSDTNDLVFPGVNVPDALGVLTLADDSVRFQSAAGVAVQVNGVSTREGGLKKDSSGEPDMLTHGSLSWYIIERGERIGVRLKDSQHPNYLNFKATELFPIDPGWQVKARLIPFDTLTTVEITNVLGDTSPSSTPGVLEFELSGAQHQLTPLGDQESENYFIIFGDATNGISTYGAGRFLVVPAVDSTGWTEIDFNRSYNMPCVFSPYATCPLPPLQNILTVEIHAGEKDYHISGGH